MKLANVRKSLGRGVYSRTMSVVQGSYSLARCTGQCAATGRALAHGEACFAVLVERDDAPGLERVDYSVKAWEEGARPAPPARVFATWRATFQPNESGKVKPLLSDEELLDLFQELGEASEPKRLAFRYVLALMLVRRKVLTAVGSGRGIIRVRPKGAPVEMEPIEVRDPGLDDGLVADAIEQLSKVVPGEAGA